MSTPLSRRKLLKTLGLSLGAVLPLSAWAENEFGEALIIPSPDKKQKLPNGPTTAITCGAGNRGNVYGDYAVQYPEELNIIGVAEPIEIRNDRYAEKHSIDKKYRFNTWEQVFDHPKFADAIIITTPDDLHYGPCMKALSMGYDVLLEKPISPSEEECRNILALAEEKGRIVAVCHVLRYAPYFEKLREIMQSGALGKVVSIQHFEPIQHVHMSHSFVRGNWHNAAKTAPIILAKSCHDLDMLRWLVDSPVKALNAFGDVAWFKSENAPEGSTARCTEGCAVEATCPYSALKIYHQKRTWLHHFDLPEDKELHGEAIMTYLRESNYGRCVYRMENDQPDHYTMNMLFENGVTASFNMEAFTSYHGRRTRVMGSLGDVVGDMTSFTHTDFLTGEKVVWEQKTDGHGGGDWKLVSDFIQAVGHQDPRLLTSTIGASIESHLMGFAAEKSRLNQMT
ncbi:MAG TPA: oxidoreductase [Cryomorphaceae bacterium]|mgnify:FL=1|jgi:predicted dehydrogenase|nr:oxidoreductase [Cryomorphaceae bacterium]